MQAPSASHLHTSTCSLAQGFPAEFLTTAAPYLRALPLVHLHFKADSPSCPSSLGPLPPSLKTLELEGMWIGAWPSNLPRCACLRACSDAWCLEVTFAFGGPRCTCLCVLSQVQSCVYAFSLKTNNLQKLGQLGHHQ